MPVSWPSGVPFFKTTSGLQRSGPQGAVVRSQMDAGPAKVRPRTTAAPRGFTGTTPVMSPAQVEAFESFFTGTLSMGALSFTATDPLSCTEKTFRFVGAYTVAPAGKGAKITAELEVLP